MNRRRKNKEKKREELLESVGKEKGESYIKMNREWIGIYGELMRNYSKHIGKLLGHQ